MNATAHAEGAAAAKLTYLHAKKIVIVDDAFDPPELQDLDAADVAQLQADIEKDVALRAELDTLLGTEPAARPEISLETIQKLWAMRAVDHGIVFAAKTTIFADALDRLSNVTPFCDHLRKLGFDVVEVGQDGVIPAGNIGLVLVDYVLGREATSGNAADALDLKTEAIKRSEAVAERFYRQFPSDPERPFIVLMSSHAKGDVLIDRFREASKLIGGLFDFVSKGELCHPPTLEFKLRTWNYSLPTRHDIQHFVEAISGAIGDITDTFRQSVMSLSYEDYAYIQGLSLQEDGHPLGDYMLWLYASQLSDLLLTHPEVTKQQKILDAMELEFVPTQQPPSANVAALYRAAVSLPIRDGARPHPREKDVDAGAPVPADPAVAYLQLGHVFVNPGQRSVRMVLNAACDLAFAPHSSRACDPDQSILLIPGTLVPLYEPIANMSLPRTELFDVAGVLYRIVWQIDRVFSWPHRLVAAKMASEGYELTSQLRLPFALQVQQAFAAGLTRVGLPVAPPICVSVRVDLYCTDDKGAARLLGPSVADGAFVVHRKIDKGFIKEFVLTPKTIETLFARSEELAEQQLRVLPPVPEGEAAVELAPDAEPKRLARLQKRADQVRESSSRHDFWFSLVSDLRAVPAAGGSVEVDPGFFRISCGVEVAGPWKGNPIIIANLLYGPDSEGTVPQGSSQGADAAGSDHSKDTTAGSDSEARQGVATLPAVQDNAAAAAPPPVAGTGTDGTGEAPIEGDVRGDE